MLPNSFFFLSHGEEELTPTKYPIMPELFYFFASGQEEVETETADIAVWLSPYTLFVVIRETESIAPDTASFFMMPPFFCVTTTG